MEINGIYSELFRKIIDINKINKVALSEEDLANQEKLGLDTGLTAIHPFTLEEIPIWIANFVLSIAN